MTDKELLELAAKAAGINGKYLIDGYGTGYFLGTHENYPSGIRWNPLTDDGDALRLAVKLGLPIIILSNRMEPHTRVCEKEEEHRNDPYAATRRCIVRAAAEIGEMK